MALLIADAVTLTAIAERLGLSVHTVKVYAAHIRQRLHLASQAEIASWVDSRRVPGCPGLLRRADRERLADQPNDTGYLQRAEEASRAGSRL